MLPARISIRPVRTLIIITHFLILQICIGTQSNACFAQAIEKSREVWEGDTVYLQTPIAAQPKPEVNKWLSRGIKYPRNARKKRITGKVVIEFIVDKMGVVQRPIVVISSGNKELDDEGLRVVSMMPQWWPGLVNGEAVPVLQKFPLTFRLDY
jgi:TonB family protein